MSPLQCYTAVKLGRSAHRAGLIYQRGTLPNTATKPYSAKSIVVTASKNTHTCCSVTLESDLVQCHLCAYEVKASARASLRPKAACIQQHIRSKSSRQHQMQSRVPAHLRQEVLVCSTASKGKRTEGCHLLSKVHPQHLQKRANILTSLDATVPAQELHKVIRDWCQP